MTGTYPALWFTSNTPQSKGWTNCDMARFLGQHAGPHGTGWKHRSTAVPLATGIAFHRGQQLIGEWILEWQLAHAGQRLMELPVEVTAWAATTAAEDYTAKATRKGLILTETDATADVYVNQLIAEQACLIEGMVWVWSLVLMPPMLREYVLVAVEGEDQIIMDCTCGLGDQFSDWTLHAARNCAGIVEQTKEDQLWRHVDRQTYTAVQFKTWGTTNAGKENKWNSSAALLANMEAASRRHGVSVDECFIDLNLKGWRGRDKGAAPTEPKYQHSPLVMGYHDPGNPPLREAQFAAKYRTMDPLTGKNHQLPTSFNKFAVYDGSVIIPPVREGASPVESWVRQFIPTPVFGELVKRLGPFPKPTLRVPLVLQGIRAEERRWRADVEFLRENGAVMPDHPLVDELISRSWECVSYDNTICEFAAICNREPGWEDPEGSTRYERRRPHHQPECDAVLALGVELPEDEEGEADGD